MVRRGLLFGGTVAVMVSAGMVRAQDDFDGLPAGPGQEEVFYACSACHSLAIVKQQNLPRSRWEYLMDWMVEEQGMAELEPDEETLIVNYLSEHYGLDEG